MELTLAALEAIALPDKDRNHIRARQVVSSSVDSAGHIASATETELDYTEVVIRLLLLPMRHRSLLASSFWIVRRLCACRVGRRPQMDLGELVFTSD